MAHNRCITVQICAVPPEWTLKNLTFLKNYAIIYIEKLKKRLFKNQSNRGNSLGEINFRGEFAKGFIPFA